MRRAGSYRPESRRDAGPAVTTRAKAAAGPVQAGTLGHTTPAADLQMGLRPHNLAELLETAKPRDVADPWQDTSLFWASVSPSLKWRHYKGCYEDLIS